MMARQVGVDRLRARVKAVFAELLSQREDLRARKPARSCSASAAAAASAAEGPHRPRRGSAPTACRSSCDAPRGWPPARPPASPRADAPPPDTAPSPSENPFPRCLRCLDTGVAYLMNSHTVSPIRRRRLSTGSIRSPLEAARFRTWEGFSPEPARRGATPTISANASVSRRRRCAHGRRVGRSVHERQQPRGRSRGYSKV